MPILYDFIYVDGKPSTEVTDESLKRAAMQLASKLEPIEEEIFQHPEGMITIRNSGVVFVDGFPTDLARKITDSIAG